MVYRVYAEKKKEFREDANKLKNDLIETLSLPVKEVRIINRYDVENIDKVLFDTACTTIFSEPPIDDILPSLPQADLTFAVAYLPGQFDQRAQSASECISFIAPEAKPIVKSAKVYLINGLKKEDEEKVKRYIINPVEAMEESLEEKDTLAFHAETPKAVEILKGFTTLNAEQLKEVLIRFSLAMDLDDLTLFQSYFKAEGKDPSITELKLCDTYWSDHCRHTTFSTHLDNIEFEDEKVKKTFDTYLNIRKELGRENKPITLMDIATIGTRYLDKKGMLPELDKSKEINACSIKIDVAVNGKKIPYLLEFKNETHNHPTEIEPFGGAATCIGGAIRDPLSGRAYVYQAMRLSGASDPTVPFESTKSGKLPQKKLVQTASAGNSSYGNQIGLATGLVDEIYHPGFEAKHMELGAVIAAVPQDQVRREEPKCGDVVILVGGRTGRDGIGGATGSSKSHKKSSLETCGAEVQKGNAPEERKLQRLFRNAEASRLIIRCNDFGAGGVSVAIGELAEGLKINLDKVPKKYLGLDGTEIAISESQERMAVVVDKADATKFLSFAESENLEATIVATVTDDERLKMEWQGQTIVDLKRSFLDSNGAEKHTSVKVVKPEAYKETAKGVINSLESLKHCSRQALSERFDSTIGRGTVIMPFGGKHQLTPAHSMVALIPTLEGDSETASIMSYGYNPYKSNANPYQGAYDAVIESVTKLIASGGSLKGTYLSLQEYFGRTGTDPVRWGYPLSALLGALQAQLDLSIAAIGGKDSMSGTFEQLDVPHTLVSFAVNATSVKQIKSNELKETDSVLTLIEPKGTEFKSYFTTLEDLIKTDNVLSIIPIQYGDVDAALAKASFGNKIGYETIKNSAIAQVGSVIIESRLPLKIGQAIGVTIDEPFINGEDIDKVIKKYEKPLQKVYPQYTDISTKTETITSDKTPTLYTKGKVAKPRVIIPVFPGTNCEYDSAKAWNKVGAESEIIIVNNLDENHINESIERVSKAIDNAEIIFIPGGFSGGDEPEGSAKFITSFFRNPKVQESVMKLLKDRDGLVGGICNGFQALIKLGLLPYGEFRTMNENSATLTYNCIGRHQSRLVPTRVSSKLSPWLSQYNIGDVQMVPISHGEGRFIAPEHLIKELINNGQIATQYVDLGGNASQNILYNPNGSTLSIEGITSPDGKVFGRMGHIERCAENLYKNVAKSSSGKFFQGAVNYFL